ncbi:MAG TPA: hypothetical protein VKV25_06595, partial [Acidimicrobiales bacterium]|nr:hypothetical protein [Acidimicrobiales bacterium]
VVVVFAVVAVLARAWMAADPRGREQPAEHPARRLLRLAFGLLWLVDGVLQTQAAMPTGLPAGVVRPAKAGAPSWARAVADAGLGVWTHHPVTAAAATVWIQVGLGLLLLLAPRGLPSRLAGAVSAGWALIVWVFGEVLGGIFTPAASWTFGLPGAALLYTVAGVAVALPEAVWDRGRFRRAAAPLLGLYLLAMAVVQAWPGRGSWRAGAGDPLASMARTMSATPQPAGLAGALRAFASFDAAHAVAVNAVVVAVLAAGGALLIAGQRRMVAVAVAGVSVVALADWVLVQDLGVLGGLGTDPNSMVPTVVLLAAAGVVAGRPVRADVPHPGGGPSAGRPTEPVLASSRRRPVAAAVATAAVAGVVLVGAVPMAVAAAGAAPASVVGPSRPVGSTVPAR